MTQTPVVVVGGGAAGMMAALAARRAGAAVVSWSPTRSWAASCTSPAKAGAT